MAKRPLAVCSSLAIVLRTASADGYGPNLTSADAENIRIQWWLGGVWMAIFAAFLVSRMVHSASIYIRTIACLNSEKQIFWSRPGLYNSLQKYLLDAPLFRLRHKREFHLSSALNAGTLPNRFQSLFLLSYLGLNIALCIVGIKWTGREVLYLAEFRNRCGVLAVMNMIPLFLLAGRNNPLIRLLGINFDTYNLIHRWLGRAVVVEGLAHGLAWTISAIQTMGWDMVKESFATDPMIQTGTVTVAFILTILLQSPSPVRNAFYETFLHVHFILAMATVGALWVHLEGMPQIYMLYAGIGIWAFERLIRFVTIVFRNLGEGGTKAELEVLPGDAVRVTLRMARPWTFQPGQHAFLYIPSVGLWTSHPFSLAWSEEEQDIISEKGMPMHRQDILAFRKTTMSFVIRRRTGFTEKLYRKAALAQQRRGTKAIVTAIVEGPYGSQSLRSYGTVLLFAAGVGITHQLPHIRDLVAAHANSTAAIRRLVLVWIIQSPEHLEWIRPWMTHILAMDGRRDVLRIMLFVTRPRSTREIHSPSASVQMFPGKPNVAALVDAEAEKQMGKMCVSVCGTGSLADEVCRASRKWMGRKNVDFVENAFGW